MRGEHFNITNIVWYCVGSPLLARGAPDFDNVPLAINGITPACAGSTNGVRLWHYNNRDHPCLRGEHEIKFLLSKSHKGSPLLARGAQLSIIADTITAGITPACAGSTLKRSLKIKLFILIFLKIY